MNYWRCGVLAACSLVVWGCDRPQADPATRSFYLGVTPWPADFTVQEADAAYRFIGDHCDMVSHHFDEGIPYEEAYTGQNLPAELLAELQNRKSRTPPGKKILLSSSALALNRHQKAPYSRYSTTIAPSTKQQWESLPADDARVVTAYVKFMKRLIDTLQPDFINYAVESNEANWDPDAFARYRELVRQVYQQLKNAYPATPILLSLMVNETPQSLALARQLIPYTDYLALSAYPYTTGSSSAGGTTTDPALLPATLFTRFLDLAPDKPMCFAETGYLAKPLSVPAYGLVKDGTEAWQDAYLKQVCTLVDGRKGKFIIWYCHKDYTAGIERLKQAGVYQDLFALWATTGLIDETNRQRASYQTWLGWMRKPVSN